jgi:glutamyl-tRNA synthetase
LKVPDYYPKYKDVVFGTVRHKGRVGVDAYEDPILLKSDGYPTYHLANVVDDHYMEITHVIRGSEWISSTPKHVALYDAFGWEAPLFAHVGLLTDEKGNKLSKRKMDIGIDSFREQGIFPETLVNFAALLGWSHKAKSDVMSLSELVDNFSLKFTKGNTVVTFGKLHFLQRAHASARIQGGGKGLQEIIDELVSALEKKYPEDLTALRGTKSVAEYITPILQLEHKKYLNPEDFISQTSYLYRKIPVSESTKGSGNAADFSKFAELSKSDWTKEKLKAKFDDIFNTALEWVVCKDLEKPSTKEYFHQLREALTGQLDGIGVFDIMTILGREETLRRLGVGEAPKPV